MDLHRQPGNCAGNVRNFCRCWTQTFQRLARRKIRTNRWPWRDGWCATARRDNERCGFSRSRSRSCADREETEEWILRQERGFARFFFQAEDGIRDDLVTGVQTCALPI